MDLFAQGVQQRVRQGMVKGREDTSTATCCSANESRHTLCVVLRVYFGPLYEHS